jgi:hypothetical protein
MSNLEVTTVNNGRVVVAEAAITRLRNRLRGEVILPGDAGYEGIRRVWNGMVDKRPALIVRCAGAADVIGAVTFPGITTFSSLYVPAATISRARLWPRVA